MAQSSASGKGKIAVIGSGLIGRCWSTLFAGAGYQVVLYDTVPSQISGALESIKNQLHDMQSKALLKGPPEMAQEAFELVSGTDDLSKALDGAFYVQECTPESLDLKKTVFTNLDKHISSSDIILASSTSCICPSLFTETLQHKNRCVVAHPINPPYYIPLVEVVPASWTDSDVVNKTVDLMKDIGQAPIVVKKEVNGFIFNRLQYAVLMEAWRLVEDGVCSPEDIDTAVTQALGLRYSIIGVFETIHLNAAGVKDYCRRYGANIFKVCEEQGGPRPLDAEGPTADVVEQAMCKTASLDRLTERRKWRDDKLASFALYKAAAERDNKSQ